MTSAIIADRPFDAARAGLPTGRWADAAMSAAKNGQRPGGDRRIGKSFVVSIIDRIEALVQFETEALSASKPLDLADSNNRKCQSLVDLVQALRLLGPADMDADLRARVAALRVHLVANLSVIGMHLEAVREVSLMISQSMQNADSDGTYDPRAGLARGRR